MKHILLIVMLVFALTDLTGFGLIESWRDLSGQAHAQTSDGPSVTFGAGPSTPLPSTTLGTGYDLMRYAISAGGGTSAANGYTLVGTAGQVDAGVAMTGGGFTLVGGFWGGGASQYKVYLPLVIK